MKNLTFNTNFKHTFNDKGRELTADFDYSVYENQSNEKDMVTRFFNGNNKEIGTPLRVTSDIPNLYNIYAIKTDFVNPLPNSNAKLEFGAKSSFVKSDNNIQFFNDGNLDIGRTNHLIYTENLNAAYANFTKKSAINGISRQVCVQNRQYLKANQKHSTKTVVVYTSICFRVFILLIRSTKTIN